MSSIITLQINEVSIIDDFNVRADGLSQATIAQYAEIYKFLPPISVFKVDGIYYLVDGWHRIGAAKKLELETIQVCVVGEGSLTEAQDFADAANLQHGIMLTADQRKQIAVRFAKRHEDWTQRQIAVAMGCNHTTVGRWLSEDLGANAPNDSESQQSEKKASQSDRAGGVDIKAVALKFRQWLNQTQRVAPISNWSQDHKTRVKRELQPIVDFVATL